jgi:ribokinase
MMREKQIIAPRVMIIGDINIDAVFEASEYPPEGGEAVVERADFRLGGSGCNTAVTLAKMGVETLLVGNLGTEPLGQMAMSYIRSAGIDTRLLRQKEEYQTGFFFILITAGGQRTMFGGRACNALPPDFEQVALQIPPLMPCIFPVTPSSRMNNLKSSKGLPDLPANRVN